MNVTIIHCDKCDSPEVLHEQILGPRQERHIKMSEFAKENSGPGMTYDVYYHTNYRLVCKECGHIVKYKK